MICHLETNRYIWHSNPTCPSALWNSDQSSYSSICFLAHSLGTWNCFKAVKKQQVLPAGLEPANLQINILVFYLLELQEHIGDNIVHLCHYIISFCCANTSPWPYLVGGTDEPFGWGGWARTTECRSQSPVPYHLATPQYISCLL